VNQEKANEYPLTPNIESLERRTYADMITAPAGSAGGTETHEQGSFVPSIPTFGSACLIGTRSSPPSIAESTVTRYSSSSSNAFAQSGTSSDQSHTMNTSQPAGRALNNLASPRAAKHRRKGERLYKRRFPPGDYAKLFNNAQLESTGDTYPCTVCVRSFDKKFEWQRHEKGVHGLNKVEWMCLFHDSGLVGAPCMFCEGIIDDIGHLEQHNVHLCLTEGHTQNNALDEQPRNHCSGHGVTARTFARKDGLVQHVRNTHLKHAEKSTRNGFNPSESWSRTVDATRADPEAHWCGFCQHVFESLEERMKHVADHFHEGFTMDAWTPRWAVVADFPFIDDFACLS
jgi:hypothetical protein